MDLPECRRGPGGMGRRGTYLNGGGVLVAWMMGRRGTYLNGGGVLVAWAEDGLT